MTTELGPKPRPHKVFTLGPGTVQLHNKSVHVKFDYRANRNRNGAANQSKCQAASQQEGRRRGLGRHRGEAAASDVAASAELAATATHQSFRLFAS